MSGGAFPEGLSVRACTGCNAEIGEPTANFIHEECENLDSDSESGGLVDPTLTAEVGVEETLEDDTSVVTKPG